MASPDRGISSGQTEDLAMCRQWILFISLCKRKPGSMQKRYVSIWLPHLTTDWHIRKQPPLLDIPFVLKAPSHSRMMVMAANRPAQQQGISAGMVLADAKALCPSLQVIDDKPGLTDQLLQRIAEWCIRFTPIASPDPPAGILL